MFVNRTLPPAQITLDGGKSDIESGGMVVVVELVVVLEVDDVEVVEDEVVLLLVVVSETAVACALKLPEKL
jgi:hypothetical protein